MKSSKIVWFNETLFFLGKDTIPYDNRIASRFDFKFDDIQDLWNQKILCNVLDELDIEYSYPHAITGIKAKLKGKESKLVAKDSRLAKRVLGNGKAAYPVIEF